MITVRDSLRVKMIIQARMPVSTIRDVTIAAGLLERFASCRRPIRGASHLKMNDGVLHAYLFAGGGETIIEKEMDEYESGR